MKIKYEFIVRGVVDTNKEKIKDAVRNVWKYERVDESTDGKMLYFYGVAPFRSLTARTEHKKFSVLGDAVIAAGGKDCKVEAYAERVDL